MNPFLLLLLVLPLAADLETDNVAKYQADSQFTYSGRTITITWCHPEPAATFDLEIHDLIGEFVAVNETGLTGNSYDWDVPRTGSYMVRLRAQYPDGGRSAFNESVTNGNVLTSGCDPKRSFILNAILAPPTGGGTFE